MGVILYQKNNRYKVFNNGDKPNLTSGSPAAGTADIHYYYYLDWLVTMPNMDPHIKSFEIIEETADHVTVRTGFETVIRKQFSNPVPVFPHIETDTIEKLTAFVFDNPYDDRRYYIRTIIRSMTILFILLNILIFSIKAQNKSDQLFFKDRLQPLKEENIFITEGFYNWCPSVIKGDDGKYHLFYSRWKKEYSFSGWLTHSEIAHAVSESPSGPWTYLETVLTGRGKGYWDAITAHNPKIKCFGGKYYLYYISTNMGDKDYSEDDLTIYWRTLLRPNQRTGVAVAPTIDGPWTRIDHPLIEPSGPITTITVNPAIDRGKDGKYYLIVKGDKPDETRFIRNQALAISDSPTGPFTMQPKAVIDDLDTEDISMWYDAKRNFFYAVFHAHTFIGMMSSPDGINWDKATEYLLMENKLLMEDGSVIIPTAPLQRPFVYVEDNEPRVLSLAVKKGDESFLVFVPIKENEYKYK